MAGKLDPDLVITRYGNIVDKRGFTFTPKDGQPGISVILGKVSPKRAADLVRHYARTGRAVRTSTVREVEAKGFTVSRLDHGRPEQAWHGIIQYPGEWTDTISKDLEACFGEVISEKE